MNMPVNWRVQFVGLIFILLATAMTARVVFLHIIDRDFLQGQGDARTNRIEKVHAHRGMMMDRKGRPLAISTPVVSIWVDPRQLDLQPATLAAIAGALGISAVDLNNKLEQSNSRKFISLLRRIPPAQAEPIMGLGIRGIYFEREYQRFYPAGEVAAHVVGFTDIKDKGQEGLELSFDQWLQGKPGEKKVVKNLYGEVVRDIKPIREAVAGKSLTLTIDLRLQYLAYRELKSAVNFYQAESGSVIILDVETGAILSLVNQPSYNPNNRKGLQLGHVRNRAITDVFEPGSTVKPFTVAVALESGDYQITSTIDTNPGFIRVGGKTIPDPRNLGVIDLGSVIAKSSQVGITKLALSLNEYDIWNMFSAVGYGQSLESGFPGESSGYLPNRRRWRDIERATFAYGYGLQVTPLQLAASYQVIASGGIKNDISMVRSEVGRGQRVISATTAANLKHMLVRVVTEGTGKRAAIDEYSVAGKTGTVRKVGKNGYEDTHHLAFFAGMAPAERPRLVGVVLINDPKGEQYGGGAIAAPLFSRIMSEALRLLSVPPRQYNEAA
ncbi:MAG: penicillin-binding protein 2 [Pseudomonadales bacterium]|nr:penicillin-binding protein 2 [Pseudomonadales bacterium]